MVEACSRALPGHVLLPGNPFLVAPKLLAEEGEGNLLLCQEAYYRGLNNNYLYYLGGSLYKFIASLAPKPYSSYSGRYISAMWGGLPSKSKMLSSRDLSSWQIPHRLFRLVGTGV